MSCLRNLWPWPWTRRKSHTDEDCSFLPDTSRTTITQSWETTLQNENQGKDPKAKFQERYVRFGIGGAGNIRKSCFHFLGAVDVDVDVGAGAGAGNDADCLASFNQGLTPR